MSSTGLLRAGVTAAPGLGVRPPSLPGRKAASPKGPFRGGARQRCASSHEAPPRQCSPPRLSSGAFAAAWCLVRSADVCERIPFGWAQHALRMRTPLSAGPSHRQGCLLAQSCPSTCEFDARAAGRACGPMSPRTLFFSRRARSAAAAGVACPTVPVVPRRGSLVRGGSQAG